MSRIAFWCNVLTNGAVAGFTVKMGTIVFARILDNSAYHRTPKLDFVKMAGFLAEI